MAAGVSLTDTGITIAQVKEENNQTKNNLTFLESGYI